MKTTNNKSRAVKKYSILTLAVVASIALIYQNNSEQYTTTKNQNSELETAKETLNTSFELINESARSTTNGQAVVTIILQSSATTLQKYRAIYATLKRIEILDEKQGWITIQDFSGDGKLVNLLDLSIVSTDFGKASAPAGHYKAFRLSFESEKTFAVLNSGSGNEPVFIRSLSQELGSLQIQKDFRIKHNYFTSITLRLDLENSILTYNRLNRLYPKQVKKSSYSKAKGELFWRPKGNFRSIRSNEFPSQT
ncbi:MAG: DUF4382 domain-containing protein [Leptospirales bacterium]